MGFWNPPWLWDGRGRWKKQNSPVWRGGDVRAGRSAPAAHVTPSSWRPFAPPLSATRQCCRRLRLFRVLLHGGGVSHASSRSAEPSGRERLHVSHRWSAAGRAERAGPRPTASDPSGPLRAAPPPHGAQLRAAAPRGETS